MRESKPIASNRFWIGLDRTYPNAECALRHGNPLELLVATILSAQCTDARVNIVTKGLFRKYRSPRDYAGVAQEELEADIRSTGFYRNKAKSIRGACAMILEKFGGSVPDSSGSAPAASGRCAQDRKRRVGRRFSKGGGDSRRHARLQGKPEIGSQPFGNARKCRTRSDADHSRRPVDFFFPPDNSPWTHGVHGPQTTLQPLSGRKGL